MVERAPLPKRELCTLEFVGARASAEWLLELFGRELTLALFDGNVSGTIPLHEILENIVRFELAERERNSAWEQFSVLQENRSFTITSAQVTDEAWSRFLTVMENQRSRWKKFYFNYGADSTERMAITTKSFSWGFRARTLEGHRNFNWDKVDVLAFQRDEPVSKVTIEIVSVRKGPLRKLQWRLQGDATRVDKLWILKGKPLLAV